MAVWIYAYGKNNSQVQQTDQILELLDSVPLDELKILATNCPVNYTSKYYKENRQMLEQNYKAMGPDAYRDYLSSIQLPYIEVEKIVDHFIADQGEREKEDKRRYDTAIKEIKAGKLKTQWQFNRGLFVNRLGYFEQDGLMVSFRNDLIRISGPFNVSSRYFIFLQDIGKEQRAYYHSYFKKVLQAFGSDFILYAHEWSGMDDEDNDAFDYNELKESANWEQNSSSTLETMYRFYFESLV